MRAWVGIVFVVVSLDRRMFDLSLCPRDLAVGPGMVALCRAMLDPIGVTYHVDAHRTGIDAVPVPGLFCAMIAVVGGDGVDLIGHDPEHVLQELPGGRSVISCDELSNAELGRPVGVCVQVKLAPGGLPLANVHMKEPDEVSLELPAL